MRPTVTSSEWVNALTKGSVESFLRSWFESVGCPVDLLAVIQRVDVMRDGEASWAVAAKKGIRKAQRIVTFDLRWFLTCDKETTAIEVRRKFLEAASELIGELFPASGVEPYYPRHAQA